MPANGDRRLTPNLATVPARDTDYWFEHELRQYPATTFDVAALRAGAGRAAFVAGEDTADLVPHQIAVAFAQELGTPLHVLPGGHVGYVTKAERFAHALAHADLNAAA